MPGLTTAVGQQYGRIVRVAGGRGDDAEAVVTGQFDDAWGGVHLGGTLPSAVRSPPCETTSPTTTRRSARENMTVVRETCWRKRLARVNDN